MLSAEIELADLDARHWRNWWALLVPPRVRARAPWALAVLEDRGEAADAPPRVCKLVVRGRGAIEPAAAGGPPRTLDERALGAWARALGVEAVIAIERSVIAQVAAQIEARLEPGQDFVAQGLVALRALRRRAGRGVWTWPALLELLPAPDSAPVQRTFDLLVPDRTALAAYVIEDDRSRLHASIIAVKDGGDVVRAGTHRALEDRISEAQLARSWTDRARGYGRALAAIEERFARPSAALFLERATLLRVMTGPSDQLARELSAGRVVIDPSPAWLLGLLGGAAMAAVAGRAASALAQMLPAGARDRASALAARARGAMKDSGAHPFALLGFDPLELWEQLRRFYRE